MKQLTEGMKELARMYGGWPKKRRPLEMLTLH